MRTREQIGQSDPVIQFLRATPSQRFVTRNHQEEEEEEGGRRRKGEEKGKTEKRKEKREREFNPLSGTSRVCFTAQVGAFKHTVLALRLRWKPACGRACVRAWRAAACVRPQLTPAVRIAAGTGRISKQAH